jgi:hypothetical protein
MSHLSRENPHNMAVPVLEIVCRSLLNSKFPCRFSRLASGGKVAVADLRSLPELSGNVMIPRIFDLYDTDRDGYLTQEDFMNAVGKLGQLYSGDDRASCKTPWPSVLFSPTSTQTSWYPDF